LANGRERIEYKNRILQKLLSHKDLCQLILNDYIDDITDSDVQNEVKKHIKRYWFVPYTQENMGTFIAFDLAAKAEGQGTVNKKTGLGFYLFTHVDLMDVNFTNGNTPQEYKSGIRTDLMNTYIQEIFNENFDFGLGKLKLIRENPKQINSVYYGLELYFEVPDSSSDNDDGI